MMLQNYASGHTTVGIWKSYDTCALGMPIIGVHDVAWHMPSSASPEIHRGGRTFHVRRFALLNKCGRREID
jgi:hypothetical protein